MSQQPLKVLHFIESEGVYGAERVILNLSAQMKQTGNTFIPIVGCIVPNKNSLSALFDAATHAGITAVKIPISNKKLLLDIPAAARQLESLGIGLIHSHGYKPSVFGFIIKLLKKIPIMATCHLWFEPSKGPLKMRVMIRLEKFFYRWFPKIVAVSDPIRSILISNGLKPDQVDVVCNGVDIPTVNSQDIETIRRELNIRPNDFVVLNSARLTRQKSQWVLVEATALLKKAGIPIKTLIIGQGTLEPELRKLIEEKDVVDQVLLLGFRNDSNAFLQLCNVFALPSIDEGMPMSLLEAAAANKPIVATSVGDIGKLIQDENSGLIIPLENPEALAQALIRIRDDAGFSKAIAQAAHDSMRLNYSSESMCNRYIDIYKNFI